MNAICSCILPVLFTGRIPRTLLGLCKALQGRLLEANTKISLWTLKETENSKLHRIPVEHVRVQEELLKNDTPDSNRMQKQRAFIQQNLLHAGVSPSRNGDT